MTVVDTDPGVDDAFALLLLLEQNINVVAIGSVHGNVSAEQAATNALHILTVAERPDIPVAIGASTPLAQPLATAEFVHGPTGLGTFADPAMTRTPSDESAADQLVRLARAHPGEVELLALGPLTNVALALEREPELPRLLSRVIVMGGAVRCPGNLTGHAEANIGHDPEAAEAVLTAGLPLTLVGLDVTAASTVDARWLAALAASDSPRARFCVEVAGHYVALYTDHWGADGPGPMAILHDVLAASIAVDPSVATTETVQVVVELAGTWTRGATLVDRRPWADPVDKRPAIDLVTAMDGDAVRSRLLASLTR